MAEEREVPVVVRVVVTLTAASIVLCTWWTIIAFAGGTMPVLGWEREGDLGFGLFWLFIVDPLAITVCYWISMAVAMAVYAPFAGASAIKNRVVR